jgi:hypothetical protein
MWDRYRATFFQDVLKEREPQYVHGAAGAATFFRRNSMQTFGIVEAGAFVCSSGSYSRAFQRTADLIKKSDGRIFFA